MDEEITLGQHEMRSENRAHKLGEKIHEMKEEIMSTDNTAAILAAMGNRGGNVDGAAGLGMGGGLIGGVVLGALLGGNRGLLGGTGAVGGEGCVTPTQLTAALAGVEDNQMNTAVLSQLGRIEAAIPYNEGQVQLALAGAQAALSNQASSYQISNIQGFANNQSALATATAGIIAVGETVKDTVNMTSAATNLAVANLGTQMVQNTYALSQVTVNEAEKTRALIQSIHEGNMQRKLAVAEARGLEDRLIGRQREVEVNVTQNVNQNQAQAQAQQQQQQLISGFNQLCAVVAGMQNAVATNSNLIIGNSAATTTGAQTANPVNVRA